MATEKVINGKSHAGNPSLQPDEGEVASAKPRREPLLYYIRSLIAMVCAMQAGSSFALVEYTYDSQTAPQRTLYVDVTPKGTKETLDVAKLSPATGVTVTNVTKRGLGTLTANNTSGYAFKIHVEQGVYEATGKYGVGTIPGEVTVDDGATFRNVGSGSDASIGATIIYAKGTGLDGVGALYKTSFDYGSPFGKTRLTGDALLSYMSPTVNMLSHVDAQGHDVDLRFTKVLGTKWITLENFENFHVAGDLPSSEFSFEDWVTVVGSTASRFSVSNLIFIMIGQRCINADSNKSTLDFEENSSFRIDAGEYLSGGKNYWRGPVRIKRPWLRTYTTAANKGILGYAFQGAVTGGGLTVEGTTTTTLQASLVSAENALPNGLAGSYADIHVGGFASIGGHIALTNSLLQLETDGVYALPNTEFAGTSMLSNGFGRIAGTLVKSDVGVLTYKSSIGADVLDLRGGSLVIENAQARQRALISGVIEGTRDDVIDVCNAAHKHVMMSFVLNGTEVYTNSVQRGLRLMYDTTCAADTWRTNSYVTYSGFIWNNSLTNETWAFAGTSTALWRLDINDTFVMGWCEWYNEEAKRFSPNGSNQTISTNRVALLPGPNRFTYRTSVMPDAQRMGPTMDPRYNTDKNEPGFNWNIGCGLMYNRTGVCTKNMNDYQELIDPGDGSLLTTCIPDDIPETLADVAYPNVGLPKFGAASCAYGTELDLRGVNQTFSTLRGWPCVTGGDVTVTETWTLDDIVLGTSVFSFDGVLTFGPQSKIIVPEGAQVPSGLRNGDIVLGTAKSIVGMPEIEAPADWTVRIDGNTIKANVRSKGLVILFL